MPSPEVLGEHDELSHNEPKLKALVSNGMVLKPFFVA
jgi:hypothetical protein